MKNQYQKSMPIRDNWRTIRDNSSTIGANWVTIRGVFVLIQAPFRTIGALAEDTQKKLAYLTIVQYNMLRKY